jgi:hypothetical protein
VWGILQMILISCFIICQPLVNSLVSAAFFNVLTRGHNNVLYWSERSACAALRRCSETKCPIYLRFLFFFSFFLLRHMLFSQKGLSRGSEVLSNKKNKILGKKKSETPSPLGRAFFRIFLLVRVRSPTAQLLP